MKIVSQNYEELSPRERAQLRQAYAVAQGGKCCHCGAALSGQAASEMQNYRVNWNLFPPNFLKYPVHLHHSHETGLTIGAVHSLCNAILWQFHGE